MKIVLTLNEVRNIICDFVVKSGHDKPTEVSFVHQYPDRSGETDVENVATIDRVEISFPTTS